MKIRLTENGMNRAKSYFIVFNEHIDGGFVAVPFKSVLWEVSGNGKSHVKFCASTGECLDELDQYSVIELQKLLVAMGIDFAICEE